VYIAVRTPIYYIACSEDIKLVTFKKAATTAKYGTMATYLIEAQKIANRKATNKRYAEKTKQNRSARVNKTYEKNKTTILSKMKALHQTPEFKEKKKEYALAHSKTDKFKDGAVARLASQKKWRQSDKGKAYLSQVRADHLEAMRLAFIQQWRDFKDRDGDCDFTKDDMDALESTDGAKIEAEVDHFLSTVRLVDGDCAGLNFKV
jgi:hypothetical protein